MPVVIGRVACQELTTHLLGAGIPAPFEYYVPPECAGAAACPVLYLLHGFGGDYTEMLGTPGTTSSAWIAALDAAPPPGFEAAPWTYADPHTWLPRRHLPMILVAPHGQTLPGGYGPGPGLDSYWVDWNPRYAAGGDQPRYPTPAPQFEGFILHELIPFVEANLPAGRGRDARAIGGVSLGGYGAYKLGLQYPDQFTAMLSVSGAHNFLFGPAPQPGALTSPVGIQPPAHVRTPPSEPPPASCRPAPCPHRCRRSRPRSTPSETRSPIRAISGGTCPRTWP